jgi:YbbR domain-containing protein
MTVTVTDSKGLIIGVDVTPTEFALLVTMMRAPSTCSQRRARSAARPTDLPTRAFYADYKYACPPRAPGLEVNTGAMTVTVTDSKGLIIGVDVTPTEFALLVTMTPRTFSSTSD